MTKYKSYGKRIIPPDPYLVGVDIKLQPKLNGDNTHCPKCINVVLIRDSYIDLACLNCGWRVSGYYKGDEALLRRLIYNSIGVLE